MPPMKCYLRNEAGVSEIPAIIEVTHDSGDLGRIGFGSPVFGTRVHIKVKSYNGPDDLRGLLVFGDGKRGNVMFDARLVKAAEVNLGVTIVTFEAKSEDNVNAPLLPMSWEAAMRQLEGTMPTRNLLNR